MNRDYVLRFKKYGFGMFVHFGLYSVLAKGEWALRFDKIPFEVYDATMEKFTVIENWAKEIVTFAKNAGCKYITLTTRHHDGFSLYDTKGLSMFDVMHTPTKRDLIKEFCDECHKQGIVPFFYHTLMDWHEPLYKSDFCAYIKYLQESIKLLCTNYGKIGGFWFDGMWDHPASDWKEDELYGIIRKYQPEAMIINNTGLSNQGKVGHPELDSVTFERGKPRFVDNSDRIRAGEMCQVMNNNWGYASGDINYKSMNQLVSDLTNCRKYDCNYLLNVSPNGRGELDYYTKGILQGFEKWNKIFGEAIYDVKSTGFESDEDFILRGYGVDYLVVNSLEMLADDNVNIVKNSYKKVVIPYDKKTLKIVWMDNNKELGFEQNDNMLTVKATNFDYGYNYCVRVAKIIEK